MSKKPKESPDGLSRRKFFKQVGGGVAGTAIMESGPLLEKTLRAAEIAGAEILGPETQLITLTINGKKRSAYIDPRWSLLDVVRDVFGLTGSKKVCGMGECGGCTMLIDGSPSYTCIMLAVDAKDSEIVTVEGLMSGEKLGEVQKAFAENDAMQCGYCIPGHVVAVHGFLKENPNATGDELNAAISGNLCRCGSQYNVMKAINAAAGKK